MAAALAPAVEPTPPASDSPRRLIRLPEVLRLVGLSRSQWYALAAAGQAPQPVHLGRAVVWVEVEIAAWIDARIAERGQEAA